MTENLMLAGFAVNLLATVGGGVVVLLKYESRMTKIETHLLHLLKRDGHHGGR